MDCSKAQSAVISEGEVLFTYEGEEAVLEVDFDCQTKKVLSKEFQVTTFTAKQGY